MWPKETNVKNIYNKKRGGFSGSAVGHEVGIGQGSPPDMTSQAR